MLDIEFYDVVPHVPCRFNIMAMSSLYIYIYIFFFFGGGGGGHVRRPDAPGSQ